MGFLLKAVISSPLSPKLRSEIENEARRNWPFIGIPERDQLPNHAHFGTNDLTTYCPPAQQSRQIKNFEVTVIDWSRVYPAVKFAFVDIECFGGDCDYSGSVIQNGSVLFQQEIDEHGHRALLGAVGIVLDSDEFAQFHRNYFGG